MRNLTYIFMIMAIGGFHFHVQAEAPVAFSYSSKEYQLNLASPGSTPAPKINWAGQQGTFQLAANYTGVSIDAKSGVVSWDKNLPLQENIIKVVARNSSGTATAQFILNHIFEGHFKGGYNDNPGSSSISGDFSMTFTPLNKIYVKNGAQKGTGRWTIDRFKKIMGKYTYANNATYIFEGTLRISKDGEPFIMGYWKPESNTKWQGYYSIVFEDHHISETERPEITKFPSANIGKALSGTKNKPVQPVTTAKTPVATVRKGGEPSGFSYSGSKYGTRFYDEGHTGNAQIDWGSGRGKFTMVGSNPGIRVEPNLGVIYWDKDLPLGDNYVDVLAENASGKATTRVNIYHPFHGMFEGGYSNSPNSKAVAPKGFIIVFYHDGTLQVENKTGNSVRNGEGKYTLTGKNNISGTYTYRDGTTYAFQCSLSYSSKQNPVITGYWKGENLPKWQGYFQIEYTGEF